MRVLMPHWRCPKCKDYTETWYPAEAPIGNDLVFCYKCKKWSSGKFADNNVIYPRVESE